MSSGVLDLPITGFVKYMAFSFSHERGRPIGPEALEMLPGSELANTRPGKGREDWGIQGKARQGKARLG